MKHLFGYAVLFLAIPALAQAAAVPSKLGSGKAPIEINADSLQVFQEENKAVFTGRVVAIQQEIRLKADKMTVYYRSPDDNKKQQGQDAIKKIDVDGNVFMTTPEETASGSSGVYNVEKNQIELHNNVVLTRGKNTLKGDTLTYDLNVGKSVMSTGSASTTADGKPTKKTRVRALFVPDETMDKKDGKKAE